MSNRYISPSIQGVLKAHRCCPTKKTSVTENQYLQNYACQSTSTLIAHSWIRSWDCRLAEESRLLYHRTGWSTHTQKTHSSFLSCLSRSTCISDSTIGLPPSLSQTGLMLMIQWYDRPKTWNTIVSFDWQWTKQGGRRDQVWKCESGNRQDICLVLIVVSIILVSRYTRQWIKSINQIVWHNYNILI